MLKREKLTFSGLTWIPKQSLQTQAPDLAWGYRHRGSGREERRTQSDDSPGTLAYHRLSFIPAHPFKEAGVTITVGLLRPQDVSGFEGLAVLLLGSLNIVLWKDRGGGCELTRLPGA